MNGLSWDHWTENGIMVLRDYLPAGKLDRINEDIYKLFRLQSPVGWRFEDLVENALFVLRQDVQRYINTARMTQDLPSVHQLLAGEQVEHIARFCCNLKFPVIATKASVHIMHEELVVPGGYHRSPPHQDWRSNQGSLDNIVVWIPTTPVQDNGLEVITGSHKHGLLPTKEHIMTPEVIEPERLGPWKTINCEPGDVVVFSGFLVHRTAAGPGLRIALSTRFNNAVESTFIERGYPTPYKYSYTTELIA
jgi:hypothetical protein